MKLSVSVSISRQDSLQVWLIRELIDLVCKHNNGHIAWDLVIRRLFCALDAQDYLVLGTDCEPSSAEAKRERDGVRLAICSHMPMRHGPRRRRRRKWSNLQSSQKWQFLFNCFRFVVRWHTCRLYLLNIVTSFSLIRRQTWRNRGSRERRRLSDCSLNIFVCAAAVVVVLLAKWHYLLGSSRRFCFFSLNQTVCHCSVKIQYIRF